MVRLKDTEKKQIYGWLDVVACGNNDDAVLISTKFEICEKETIIGREAGLTVRLLHDPKVSRRHCKFLIDVDANGKIQASVKNISSKSTTSVNGVPLVADEIRPIISGDDKVRITHHLIKWTLNTNVFEPSDSDSETEDDPVELNFQDQTTALIEIEEEDEVLPPSGLIPSVPEQETVSSSVMNLCLPKTQAVDYEDYVQKRKLARIQKRRGSGLIGKPYLFKDRTPRDTQAVHAVRWDLCLTNPTPWIPLPQELKVDADFLKLVKPAVQNADDPVDLSKK